MQKPILTLENSIRHPNHKTKETQNKTNLSNAPPRAVSIMPLCDFKCKFLSFSRLFNDLARQRDPYHAHIAFDCVPITIGHLHSANLAEIQSEEYAAAVQRLCGGDGGTCRLIGKLEILVDRMCTNIGDFGRVRGSKQRSQPSLTGSLRKHSAHSSGSLCIIQPK